MKRKNKHIYEEGGAPDWFSNTYEGFDWNNPNGFTKFGISPGAKIGLKGLGALSTGVNNGRGAFLAANSGQSTGNPYADTWGRAAEATGYLLSTIGGFTEKRPESLENIVGIYGNGGHLFLNGSNMMNIASTVGALAGNAFQQANTRDAKSVMSALNSSMAQPVENDSYDTLNQSWLNQRRYGYTTAKDLRPNSLLSDIGNGISAGAQGSMTGLSVGGPWGAVIGGVIGTGSSILGSLIGRNKAKKQSNRINRKVDFVNQWNENSLNNRLNNLWSNQLNLFNSNYSAYGGPLGYISGPIDYSMAMQYLDMKNNENKDKILANGGGLHTHGTDWNTGLNYVGNGGSHEANPYDGVQMGIAPDGQPNLVEEGEVIWNGDYVFSKRLKVPKSLREKYKLGGPLSFADAVMKVNKEAEERPNDPITIRGREAILGNLAEVQDVQRAKKEAKEQARQEVNDVMLQQIMNQGYPTIAASGGKIHIKESKKGTFTAEASKHGMGVQEFASKVLANPDNYSPAMRKKANFARNASKWNHADGGHLFWPGGPFDPTQWWFNQEDFNPNIDRYLNGEVPSYTNYFNGLPVVVGDNTSPMMLKALNTRIAANHFPQLNGFNGTLEYPIKRDGILKDTRPVLSAATLPLVQDTSTSTGRWLLQQSMNSPIGRAILNEEVKNSKIETPTTSKEEKQTSSKKNNSWLTALRYAPALGAGIGVLSDLLGWTNKPDYSSANALLNASKGVGNAVFNPIGDYIAYNPLDRMFYLNQLNANAEASRKAILDTASGNRGTAMAGILVSDNSMLNNIGNLARQAEEYNLAQRQKAAEFNRSTNMFNSEGFLKASQANQGAAEVRMRAAQAAAQLRDAIDQRVGAAKSANLTNLFDSLGDIGREEFTKNMINSNPAWLFDLDWAGMLGYKGTTAKRGGRINKKKGK